MGQPSDDMRLAGTVLLGVEEHIDKIVDETVEPALGCWQWFDGLGTSLGKRNIVREPDWCWCLCLHWTMQFGGVLFVALADLVH